MEWFTWIAILIFVLAVCGLTYLRAKGRITTGQFVIVLKWVEKAVDAAEQLMGPKTGAQKKAFVMDFLRSLFGELSEGQLEVLLEAQVKKMNSKDSKKTDEDRCKKEG